MKKERLLLYAMCVFIMSTMLIACSKVNDEPIVNETPDALVLVEPNTLTAFEAARLMGNGTNLGNTMEAYGRNEVGIAAEVSAYETIWGQPLTTQEMLTGMKAAGFDSIRIPVAWTNMMDFENGDYTIAPAYLDRVEEIVNYALNADMYVVINDHWDGGWWGMFGSASQETRENAMALYLSMWTQIAERFKHYPYTVILESANEELGNRLNDRDIARDSGTLSEDECYHMTNVINQAFVDLIRSTGGKNEQRFLLIAGYNTDIDMTIDDRFQMPTDTLPDKLMLSVHYYTPWSYCGTSGVASWGTESHYRTMNENLEKMTKFTKLGYPVVFGEYAVLTKSDGSLKNNTLEFTTNFLDNCDLYGYVPMLWDTNAFFKRDALKIVDDALAELYYHRRLEAQISYTDEALQAKAMASMENALAIAIENDKNAPEPLLSGDEDAVAWIMFSSLDYNLTHSVGDIYDPTLSSEAIIATDVIISEAGTYTVGLDFTQTENGYAEGISFSAIGISNGEILFPKHILHIKEILINGEPYAIKGVPYTTSDDDICTRLNLYNGWVTKIDVSKARFSNPNMANFLSATIIDPKELDKIETLFVTFEYRP